MKSSTKTIGALVTAAIGLLVGFFGVFSSVFTDSSTYERLVTILVILIIYAVLGIVIGLIKPEKTWIYVAFLAAPGIILLAVYLTREFNFLYILYAVLIGAVSFSGGRAGRSFKIKK
jgi:hypothetical protein